MPGFFDSPYQRPGPPQPIVTGLSPIGQGLTGVAAGLNDIADAVVAQRQKKWQQDMDARRESDAQDRFYAQLNQTGEQQHQANLATTRGEAMKGLYTSLSPDQSAETVQMYDPATGTATTTAPRYQALGGDLGYEDVTRDASSDYTRGLTQHIAQTKRQRAIDGATASGMDSNRAAAMYDADPNRLATALEQVDLEGRDAAKEAAAHAGRMQEIGLQGTNAATVARIRAANRGGGGAGGPTPVTRHLGAVGAQIRETQHDLGVAQKLDDDPTKPPSPTTQRLQTTLDSLKGVQSTLASQLDPDNPPAPKAPPPNYTNQPVVGKNGGQQAFNAALPGLLNQRARAIQQLVAKGHTQADAEQMASDAYNTSVRQLSQHYGLFGDQ